MFTAEVPPTTVETDVSVEEQPTTASSMVEASQSWSKAAIQHLLVQVKERYNRLTDKVTKNKIVWKEVAAQMQEKVPGVTESQCDQKWRTLKLKFKKYIDNQRKTGRGRINKPEFFDEILEIVGSSHTVHPPHTVETMTLATAETEAPGEHSQTSSVAGDQPASAVSEELGPSQRRKRMKPATTRKRMEEKIDKLIAEQTAAREKSEEQFGQMMQMFEKQHSERMSVLNNLVKAVSGSSKRKSRRTEADSS